ncbi:MAG: alpha/beta fold hydrolase [Rubrobacteraceae bacterium]|nr:alpha/beta fold hydrolase [Rubrobacteraceae bacterium]
MVREDRVRSDPPEVSEVGRFMVRLKVVGAAGAAGGLWVLNRRLEGVSPPVRLGGEARRFRWRGQTLAYSVAGEGEPLLLVHGVYAGASSLEFRANFEELSGSFRVYALDLLGCGFSQKPRRRYGPEDVASQIEAFVREEIGAGAHLVASSLSAALVVPAAVRSPKVFKKLVLVCPTGYGTLDRPSGLLGDAILGLFRTPILGESLYHALVSRAGTRYYLEKMAYHDPRLVTEDVVEDYYRAGHGPGAKHFPAAFVAGKLNLGIPDLWPRVPHKSLVCWGREARTVPVSDQSNFTRNNPRAEPRVFRDAALLPHVERAEAFNAEVRRFLSA